MNKLKPCPICNNNNVILYNENLEYNSQIICPVCMYSLGGFLTVETLIKNWNEKSENKLKENDNINKPPLGI